MSFKIRRNRQVGNATGVWWGWCDGKVSVYLKQARSVNQLINKGSAIAETAMFSSSGFAFLSLHLFLTDQGLSVTD